MISLAIMTMILSDDSASCPKTSILILQEALAVFLGHGKLRIN